MAVNINAMKQAMQAGMTQTRSGTGPMIGDLRTTATGELEIYTQNGWISNRVNQLNVTTTGPMPYGSLSPALPSMQQQGSFTVATPPPKSQISVETKLGTIVINLDTGDLTIPPNIGRNEAIREFWLGFQEHFQPTNKAKYEEQIYLLKKELADAKTSATLMQQENIQQASKRVAEKIRKKYNGEKFIMIKPEDLIRFIEEK
jgi:hypothetical protein